MPFTVVDQEEESGHIWIVATATSRLDDPADLVIGTTAALIRTSYGEHEIMADALTVMSSEIEDGSFQTQHLMAAIRNGMPDPDAEGDKPPALTTYRSQSAEMVAKAALAHAFHFQYPAAPQRGATNANQPILGFDGWGLLQQQDGAYTLVLIQVKATDEPACPPREAHRLAEECQRIPRDRSALCRALTVLALALRNDPLQPIVLQMLTSLGNNRLPDMHVAPAIVRGVQPGRMGDIHPVRQVSSNLNPATARGIVVTIGVSLDDFGKIVMRKARES